MYALSTDQIEFVRLDIQAQGIESEGLQQDLLDHICCVIEHELTDGGDFEMFYKQRVKHFYKWELKEIQEETTALLAFKNYYVVKKIMLVSGGVLTALLVLALVLKFLHLPGASIALLLGVTLLNFVFLPLLFALKIKENRNFREKAMTGLITLCGMLFNLGLIFKVQHWPGANMLFVAGFVTLLLVFLPVYYFTGIRQPETSVNTIVSSVILLSIASLVLILARSPKALQDLYAGVTTSADSIGTLAAFQDQQIREAIAAIPTDTTGDQLYHLSGKFQRHLLFSDTGNAQLQQNGKPLSEKSADEYLNSPQSIEDFQSMLSMVQNYNQSLPEGSLTITAPHALGKRSVAQAIQDLIRIQIIIRQNKGRPKTPPPEIR